MKRNAFITAIAAMLVVLMFAGCQPNNPSGPIVLPGGGGGGGSSVLTADEKEAVSEAIEAIFTNMGSTISASQTENEWESDDYKGAYNLTVVNEGWTLEAWGKKTDPGTASSAARSRPTGDWDIIIETSSSDLAANNPIKVTLDGTVKNVPVSEVIGSTTTIPAVEGLIVNIRAAKHSRGAEEDGDNWKFVGKISQGNDGKVTIQVNAAGMKEITSSDGRGTERWIPVLISVDGVTDIKEITWGTADQSAALGDGDVSDVNDMLDLEGNKPKDGEFVVWLDADATPSVDRVIKVGDKTKNLSFVFEQADIYPELTTEDLNNEELKKEFSALFAMFQNPAHLRTMHRLEGFEDETFTVNSTETTSNAISFKVTFNGYKFDSTDAYKVNGDATMTFSGSVSSDNSALEADKWNIISDKLTFASVSDSSTSYTAKAVDMSGSVVAGGAFGTTSAVFKFKLDDTGKYANDILDYPENDEESTAQTPCFGLSNFSEDSSAALVEINRTVTGALINKYIEAMTSQQQSATFS